MSNFDETLMKRLTKLEREVERLQVKERPGAWKDWTPTYGAGTGMTFTSVSTISARYLKIGKVCLFKLSATGTIGVTPVGTPTWYVTANLPFNVTKFEIFTAMVGPAGNPNLGYCRTVSAVGNTIVVGNYNRSTLSTGDLSIYISGFYEVA